MSTMDSVVERVRRVDPIREIDLRQWSASRGGTTGCSTSWSAPLRRPTAAPSGAMAGRRRSCCHGGIGHRGRRVGRSRRARPGPDPRPPRCT